LEKPLGFHKKGSLKRALAVARKPVNVLTVNSDAPEYGKGGLE